MGFDEDLSSLPILQKIRAMLPQLSKVEQRVATCILEHPEKLINSTVSDLAEDSGASDASVIRACKSLGFSSFQEFKITMAKNMAAPLRANFSTILPEDTPDMVAEKIFQENIYTLQLTYSSTSTVLLAKAAEYLRTAERVLVFGMGESNAVAVDFQHKMIRLGITAIPYIDGHLEQMAAVISRPSDVVVAFSHMGDAADVVDAAKRCKRRGAKVICLTGAARSPLGKLADITLTTSARETQFRTNSISSRIAQMTLVDCICNIIYLSNTEEYDAAFLEFDEALKGRRL